MFPKRPELESIKLRFCVNFNPSCGSAIRNESLQKAKRNVQTIQTNIANKARAFATHHQVNKMQLIDLHRMV